MKGSNYQGNFPPEVGAQINYLVILLSLGTVIANSVMLIPCF